MSDSTARDTLTELFGGIGELLKNKAVIEALLAGVGAFSAVNRVKNKDSDASGFELSGILDALPQIMPLLGLLSPSGTGGDGEVSVSEGRGEESVAVTAETLSEIENAASGGAEGGFASLGADKRENLLLALKPFLSETKAAAADAIIRVNRISGFFV